MNFEISTFSLIRHSVRVRDMFSNPFRVVCENGFVSETNMCPGVPQRVSAFFYVYLKKFACVFKQGVLPYYF